MAGGPAAGVTRAQQQAQQAVVRAQQTQQAQPRAWCGAQQQGCLLVCRPAGRACVPCGRAGVPVSCGPRAGRLGVWRVPPLGCWPTGRMHDAVANNVVRRRTQML